MCFESPTSVLPLPKNAVRMASAAAKARSRRGVSDTPAASFEKMLPLVLRPRADQISNSISCPWPLQMTRAAAEDTPCFASQSK